MAPSAILKRLLPRSLFGRALLIIVTPLILLQVISTWIFYERHWQTIERRLSSAVAGDIAMVIQQLGHFRSAGDQRWIIDNALGALALNVVVHPGAIMPNADAPVPRGWSKMADALDERVRRPFVIDPDVRPRELLIRVQLPDGVLDVVVARERLFSSTTYIFVLWMVGSSLGLFAVASLFMRNQVRPIRRLAAAADSFGKGREVPDFRPAGAIEVRQAAVAFNRMRERIRRTISQRTEMLAGVSHDLRTPLTRFKLQLAMLGDGEDIAALKADVVEMEKMVDEYLAFARGESAEAVVDTDLGGLLAEVVDTARRGGAAITLAAHGNLTLPVRPNAFKRCITNLVANAVRHGTHVAVGAERSGAQLTVTVDDDGAGIPEDKREEVFKPFYRLESSRSRATGGTGLGLTIARDVARGHGGDIVLDAAPQGGLRARLWLPV